MPRLFIIIIFAGFLTSCGTFRPWQDTEVAAVTGGVRTMMSNICWTGAGCMKNAIEKAKDECREEHKTYEYVSHHIFFNSRVLYKCI